MRPNKLITTLLVAAPLAFLLAGCESGPKKSDAKITKAQAEQIALSKVPNGTIKEAELEKEKGHLIWSFDMAIPGSKDIKEVNVDAITGEIVAVETENPAQQAKEKDDEKEGK